MVIGTESRIGRKGKITIRSHDIDAESFSKIDTHLDRSKFTS